jgi:hypothetical protein
MFFAFLYNYLPASQQTDRQTLKIFAGTYCSSAIHAGKQAGRWVAGRKADSMAGRKTGRKKGRL